MKQPTVTIDGKQYNVMSINWHRDGGIAFISINNEDSPEMAKCIFNDEVSLEKLLQEG